MMRSTKPDNDKIIDLFSRSNAQRLQRTPLETKTTANVRPGSRATGPARPMVIPKISAVTNLKKPVLKIQTVPETRQVPIKENTLSYVIQQAENKERRHEMHPPADKIYSVNSIVSQVSSVSTVNCNGDQYQFNPLRMLQFLFLELKDEVKEYLPKDERASKCKKLLRDMTKTLKNVSFDNNQLSGDHEGLVENRVEQIEFLKKNQQHLEDVAAEYLAKQTKLDADCCFLSQTCDEMKLQNQNLTDELTKSNQEIVQLRSEITFLQDKLKNTINDEKLDDKCKELKSEIQNLQKLMELQKLAKSDDLIDTLNRKLTDSSEKISVLEGKCAQTKKMFFFKELENAKLDILLKSRNSQMSEIGRELSNIHSAVHSDISSIKEDFLSLNSKSSSISSIAPSALSSNFSTKSPVQSIGCHKTSQNSHNEGGKKSDADIKVMEDFIEKRKQMLADEIDSMTSLKGCGEASTQQFPVASNTRLSAMNSESANHRSNNDLFNYQEFHDVLDNVTLPSPPEQFGPIQNLRFPQHMNDGYGKDIDDMLSL